MHSHKIVFPNLTKESHWLLEGTNIHSTCLKGNEFKIKFKKKKKKNPNMGNVESEVKIVRLHFFLPRSQNSHNRMTSAV